MDAEEREEPAVLLLNVIALEPEVEKTLSDSLVQTSHGLELQLAPQLVSQFFDQLSHVVGVNRARQQISERQ